MTTGGATGTSVPMSIASGHGLALGFLLGTGAGLMLGPRAGLFQPLADLFIVSLKVLGPPIALFALLSARSSLSARKLSRLGVRAFGWYLMTALIAASIGVIVAYQMGVGAGFQLPAIGVAASAGSSGTQGASHGFSGVFKALIDGPLLYVAIYTLFLVLLRFQWRRSKAVAQARGWRRLLDECARAAYRILGWLMLYAPIGVFALMALTFAQLRFSAATHLITVLLAVYLAQAIVCAGCILALKAFGHAPGAFLSGAKEALLTAFATGSSAATLPVEFAAAEHRLGIARERVGLVLPLGLAMHKLGTAVHQAGIMIFAANAMGETLSLPGLTWLTLFTLAASVMTPPIYGGSWVALGFVFSSAGLPLEMLGIVAAIPFLGKFNTPINSLGRLVSTMVLAGPDRSVRQASGYSDEARQ